MIIVYTDTSLTASFCITTWVSRHQKGTTKLDFNEPRDDGMALTSAIDQMQIICTLLQTDNHASTSSLNLYRSDALPDAQPTVSKHLR